MLPLAPFRLLQDEPITLRSRLAWPSRSQSGSMCGARSRRPSGREGKERKGEHQRERQLASESRATSAPLPFSLEEAAQSLSTHRSSGLSAAAMRHPHLPPGPRLLFVAATLTLGA
jgi:hypothetical protein